MEKDNGSIQDETQRIVYKAPAVVIVTSIPSNAEIILNILYGITMTLFFSPMKDIIKIFALFFIK